MSARRRERSRSRPAYGTVPGSAAVRRATSYALDYNHLKQESQSARYYCNPRFTWRDFDDLMKKADRVAQTWLPKAQQCVTGALDPPTRPTA